MRSETIIFFIVDFTIYRTIKDIKKYKNKMNKKQIKRFAEKVVKKTKCLFHYEEDTWEQFFSKDKLSNI